MFRKETISELRRGSTELVLVILLSLYNEDQLIYNLTNSDKDILSNNVNYRKFFFKIDLPVKSANNTSDIGIVFPNYSIGDIKREEILKTTRCQFAMFDRNFPNDAIIAKREIFLNGYSKTLTAINMTFVSSYITNRKFPFRNYNSVEHPRLYERD